MHLLRGVLGFGLVAAALQYAQDIGWWVVLPALGALVCFRGCPMCWTFGLIETVISGKTGCVDGSCADK